MGIDLHATIENIPLKELKKVFKKSEYIDADFLMVTLNLDTNKANKLIAELFAQGFIEKDELRPEIFRTTSNGKRLAATSIQRITNKKAVILFNAFLDRVKYVNSYQSEYAYWVDRVALAGSFLVYPNQPDFGDIDLFVNLKPRYENKSKQDDLNWKRIKLYKQVFPNFVSRISWPRTEVVKFLKNKSRFLSIEDDYRLHEVIEPKGAFKVIYQADSFPVNV